MFIDDGDDNDDDDGDGKEDASSYGACFQIDIPLESISKNAHLVESMGSTVKPRNPI